MGDSEITKQISIVVPTAQPTVEVHRLRLDEQIAEKKYQLARTKAELERFMNGQIKKIQADCIMLEREIAVLMAQKDKLDQFGTQEIIDVNNF